MWLLFSVMRSSRSNQPPSPKDKAVSLADLPPLATADQIAAALQCSSRTVLNWSKSSPPRIPAAFHVGKIIRFNPRDVASALGIPLNEPGKNSVFHEWPSDEA